MALKNILIVTSLYPAKDIKIINGTSVCHYFAKEWVKLGYNVKVIFNYNVYPVYFYPVLKLCKSILSSNSDAAILSVYQSKPVAYTFEEIDVYRVPIKKSPKSSFSQAVLEQQCQTIIEYLQESDFKPDIVLGHFLHPNLELSVMLAEHYHVESSITLHGLVTSFSERDASYFKKVTRVGFRSLPIRRSFESQYGKCDKAFYCPSGIPTSYLNDSVRTFNTDKLSCLYVGNLMKRKHPLAVAQALNQLHNSDQFSLTYVGSGGEEKTIKIFLKHAKLRCVSFKGRLSREQVLVEMDKADCFIMISERETFGLVYLEAMSRGCIVIASSNEGMEGIINDGVNGFLCRAGNVDELSALLQRISTLSIQEKQTISRNAQYTAKLYIDKKVAVDYLRSVNIF